MEIGQNLRKIREEHNLRQEDIAGKLNLAKNTYNQYENNKRTPTIESLWKIADFYKTSIDYLVGRYKN